MVSTEPSQASGIGATRTHLVRALRELADLDQHLQAAEERLKGLVDDESGAGSAARNVAL